MKEGNIQKILAMYHSKKIHFPRLDDSLKITSELRYYINTQFKRQLEVYEVTQKNNPGIR